MNKYKNNHLSRWALLLVMLLSFSLVLTACGLFIISKEQDPDIKTATETIGTEETTLDKTKLPPEPVIIVDPATGESKELEMPSFANLAEQESYVKAMNEQYLEVDLGEKNSENTSAPTQDEVREHTDDKGAYLLLREAESCKFIILPLNELQDQELQGILKESQSEAVKSKEAGGAKSTLALRDGSVIRFDASHLYPEWKEDEEFTFVNKEGEVFQVLSSHALPRRLFELLSFNKDFQILNDIENPEETLIDKGENPINVYVEGAASKTSISLVMENKGDEDYIYNSTFSVEVLKGKEFVGIGENEGMMVLGVAEHRLLKAGERVILMEDWGDTLGELPRGVYKIKQRFSPFEDKNQLKERICEIYVFIP